MSAGPSSTITLEWGQGWTAEELGHFFDAKNSEPSHAHSNVSKLSRPVRQLDALSEKFSPVLNLPNVTKEMFVRTVLDKQRSASELANLRAKRHNPPTSGANASVSATENSSATRMEVEEEEDPFHALTNLAMHVEASSHPGDPASSASNKKVKLLSGNAEPAPVLTVTDNSTSGPSESSGTRSQRRKSSRKRATPVRLGDGKNGGMEEEKTTSSSTVKAPKPAKAKRTRGRAKAIPASKADVRKGETVEGSSVNMDDLTQFSDALGALGQLSVLSAVAAEEKVTPTQASSGSSTGTPNRAKKAKTATAKGSVGRPRKSSTRGGRRKGSTSGSTTTKRGRKSSVSKGATSSGTELYTVHNVTYSPGGGNPQSVVLSRTVSPLVSPQDSPGGSSDTIDNENLLDIASAVGAEREDAMQKQREKEVMKGIQDALTEEQNVNIRRLIVDDVKGGLDETVWDQLQEEFSHAYSSKKFRRFCMYEWFYPNIDKLFFAQNEFVDCLDKLGLGTVSQLTRTEWSEVRSMMGRPRRLSPAFLRQEREKLGRYQDHIRKIQQHQIINSELVPIPEEVPSLLSEGHRVIARHPWSHEIHSGVVLGMPRPREEKQEDDSLFTQQVIEYRVKFDRKELGSRMVADYDVMAQGNVKSMIWNPSPQSQDGSARAQSASSGLLSDSSTASFPAHEDDYRLIANLLRLLDRKGMLVAYLHDINELAERLVEDHREKNPTIPHEFSLEFKKRYAWVVNQLELTGVELEASLKQLRLRTSATMRQAKKDGKKKKTVEQNDVEKHLDQRKALDICREEALMMVLDVKEKLNLFPNQEIHMDDDQDNIQATIVRCLTLVLLIKVCSECGLSPGLDMDTILSKMKEKSKVNLSLFEGIERSVKHIQASLSST